MSGWLDRLDSAAPDLVAVFRDVDRGRIIGARREIRRRSGPGSAEPLAGQLAAIASAMADMLRRMPDHAFLLPGGEEDWNVAQALNHDATSRAGLAMAAALAATGRWPAEAPAVIPSVPGPPDTTREALLHRLDRSQRIVERSARAVAGHETDPCPLEHPVVGRFRCGEWILWAGVHDLMHVEQLHKLSAGLATADGVAQSEPVVAP